jgi:hypothetical protein
LEKVSNAMPHTVDGAFFRLAEQDFELCEDLLDRVEVGAIGWQEDEPGARGTDGPPDSLALVGAEIVHDDNVAGLQRWHQQLLDIGSEALTVDRPVDDAGRRDPVVPECREEGHRAPMAVWDLSPERGAPSPPAMGSAHVGLCPGLIDKDETGRIDFRLVPSPPGAAARDVRTILLGREHGFF